MICGLPILVVRLTLHVIQIYFYYSYIDLDKIIK